MDRQATREGMDRVLVHLLEPLEKLLRLQRPKKVTEWQHVAGLAEIQQRLQHLTEGELVALRETVIEANRATPGIWPTPGTIIAQGLALRLPEDGVTERVRKLIEWAAARALMPEADLPWLFLWLRKNMRVPTRYDLGQIAEQADLDRRALARIEAEVARGAGLASADADLVERVRKARAALSDILPAAVAA